MFNSNQINFNSNYKYSKAKIINEKESDQLLTYKNISFQLNNLRFIFSDLSLNSLYSIVRNEVIQKTTAGYSFLISSYIVTPKDLFYGDCQLKLEFLKKNVLFNLFYQIQIDHFLSNCNL